MDLFEIPDDYKPEKQLTTEEMDQITDYLKGHPLFLKELPEDTSNNQTLMALKSLIDEEDPDVAAENLNKQANKRLQQGPNSPYYLKEAYAKYTQAIKLKCKNNQLNAKLHANRAAINLKYKNYGKVIQDCKLALSYVPDYLKAFYRMGKAYIMLKKYTECIQLLKDQKVNDLLALKKEAQLLSYKQNEQMKKMQEKKSSYSAQIEAYFQERKWKLGKQNEQLPQGVQIEFFQGKISIPLIIVYPQFNQFDLIAKTSQTQKIGDCLKELFASPLPWDTQNQYNFKTIQLYLELEEAILLKLPNQATIRELASRKPVNGAIELIVVANNQFSAYFKQQHKLY